MPSDGRRRLGGDEVGDPRDPIELREDDERRRGQDRGQSEQPIDETLVVQVARQLAPREHLRGVVGGEHELRRVADHRSRGGEHLGHKVPSLVDELGRAARAHELKEEAQRADARADCEDALGGLREQGAKEGGQLLPERVGAVVVEQIVASRHLGRQVGRQLWGREQHPAQKGGGRVHVARRERQRLVERVHKQRRAAHTQPVEGERLEEAMPRGRQPRVADGGGEHDLERELHVDRKGALGDAVEEGDAEVRERARAEQPLRGQGEQGELLALAQRLALLTAHRGRWHRNRVEVTAHIQGAQERRHIRRIETIDGRLGDQVQQLPELE